MKVRPVGAELFHADRQTDGWTGRHDETNSRFLQFFERTKKEEGKNSERGWGGHLEACVSVRSVSG